MTWTMREEVSGTFTDELLIRVARRFVGADDSDDRLLEWLGGPLDWSAVLVCAQRHGLAPLLHTYLCASICRSLVPPWVLRELHTDFVMSVAREMRCMAELSNIGQVLNERGFEPIILKGPAIAERLYDDPAQRPYEDIDFLVEETDWLVLREALVTAGLRPDGVNRSVLPPRLTSADMCDHTLQFRTKTGLVLEVKLDPLELGLRARTLEGFFATALPLNVGTSSFRRLAPEYELVQLCLHLNRHGFDRLIWFVDIARLVAAESTSLDWAGVRNIAEAEGMQASIYFTLSYCRALVGAMVPQETLEVLRPPRLKGKLWSVFWPAEAVLGFCGERDGAIVCRKSMHDDNFLQFARRLVPNLLLTGRAVDKMRHLARKVFPSKTFMAAKYGTEVGKAGYGRLFVARLWSFVTRAPTAVSATAPPSVSDREYTTNGESSL